MKHRKENDSVLWFPELVSDEYTRGRGQGIPFYDVPQSYSMS